MKREGTADALRFDPAGVPLPNDAAGVADMRLVPKPEGPGVAVGLSKTLVPPLLEFGTSGV